jgi:hypothetical protein
LLTVLIYGATCCAIARHCKIQLKFRLFLSRVAAFSRWLDRMERDFESIDREDVSRVEYQQGLQRFRVSDDIPHFCSLEECELFWPEEECVVLFFLASNRLPIARPSAAKWSNTRRTAKQSSIPSIPAPRTCLPVW